MSTLHIVILAAGQGKRMRSRLPKVLHRIGGTPMLERVVNASRELDEKAVVHVVYGHGGDQVQKTMSHLDLQWSEQAEQLGTGHAVMQAMPQIPDGANVLILYGDVPLIKSSTLVPLLAAVSNDEVGVLTVSLTDPQGYGRILRNEAGAVVGIVEEKDATEEQRLVGEVNTGIIAAGASRMRGWLGALSNDNAQGEYYLTDVVGAANADGVRVRGIEATSEMEVSGVNDRVQLSVLERHFQLEQAQGLMRSGATLADPARVDIRGHVTVGTDVIVDVNVVFEGDVEIGDGVVIGPNVVLRNCEIATGAKILANSHIDGAQVGPDSIIGPFARLRPGARLKESVHIGNFVEVKNSLIGPGSKANHLTYLGDSEIGAGVNVGAGTITCNYDGANKHKTIIGDGAFIGSGVELVAPVTIEDGATIGAGSTIAKNAPSEALTLERSKQVTLSGWKRPVKQLQS